jgi:hypothetical protein
MPRPDRVAQAGEDESLREVLRSASDVAAESLRVFSATTLLVGCDVVGVGFAFSLSPSSSLQ